MHDGHVTKSLGQYPAINEIGRARQAMCKQGVVPPRDYQNNLYNTII